MPKKLVVRHEVVQPPDTSYRLIPLTQGQNAIVDVEDYDWLNQWPWCAWWSKDTKSFYAERREAGHTIYMARKILGCGPKEEADHSNHDTLDNRRDNLRKATSLQNNSNQKIRSDNTSGFKGVSKHGPKWRAYIMHNKIFIHLGIFVSAEEAAHAYDEAAKKLHREFAVLNFS